MQVVWSLKLKGFILFFVTAFYIGISFVSVKPILLLISPIFSLQTSSIKMPLFKFGTAINVFSTLQAPIRTILMEHFPFSRNSL